jgi:hypothetical protein
MGGDEWRGTFGQFQPAQRSQSRELSVRQRHSHADTGAAATVLRHSFGRSAPFSVNGG